MTHDEMISVIQAHKEGKEIEYHYFPGKVVKSIEETRWLSMESPQFFNFSECIYRVKPKPPKPREWRVPSIILNSPCLLKWFAGDSREIIHVREVLDVSSVSSGNEEHLADQVSLK